MYSARSTLNLIQECFLQHGDLKMLKTVPVNPGAVNAAKNPTSTTPSSPTKTAVGPRVSTDKNLGEVVGQQSLKPKEVSELGIDQSAIDRFVRSDSFMEMPLTVLSGKTKNEAMGSLKLLDERMSGLKQRKEELTPKTLLETSREILTSSQMWIGSLGFVAGAAYITLLENLVAGFGGWTMEISNTNPILATNIMSISVALMSVVGMMGMTGYAWSIYNKDVNSAKAGEKLIGSLSVGIAISVFSALATSNLQLGSNINLLLPALSFLGLSIMGNIGPLSISKISERQKKIKAQKEEVPEIKAIIKRLKSDKLKIHETFEKLYELPFLEKEFEQNPKLFVRAIDELYMPYVGGRLAQVRSRMDTIHLHFKEIKTILENNRNQEGVTEREKAEVIKSYAETTAILESELKILKELETDLIKIESRFKDQKERVGKILEEQARLEEHERNINRMIEIKRESQNNKEALLQLTQAMKEVMGRNEEIVRELDARIKAAVEVGLITAQIEVEAALG